MSVLFALSVTVAALSLTGIGIACADRRRGKLAESHHNTEYAE